MEKFGIFNILSALSALSAQNRENSATDSEKMENNSPIVEEKTDAENVGIFTSEERKNKMLEVLTKHDEISKRIDKKKVPR